MDRCGTTRWLTDWGHILDRCGTTRWLTDRGNIVDRRASRVTEHKGRQTGTGYSVSDVRHPVKVNWGHAVGSGESFRVK